MFYIEISHFLQRLFFGRKPKVCMYMLICMYVHIMIIQVIYQVNFEFKRLKIHEILNIIVYNV
jgi:hypothetical protein